MIKKMWVKFNGMEVECLCDHHHRKCDSKECKPFVVKFIEITEEEKLKEAKAGFDKSSKRFQSELVKTLKVLDKIKK